MHSNDDSARSFHDSPRLRKGDPRGIIQLVRPESIQASETATYGIARIAGGCYDGLPVPMAVADERKPTDSQIDALAEFVEVDRGDLELVDVSDMRQVRQWIDDGTTLAAVLEITLEQGLMRLAGVVFWLVIGAAIVPAERVDLLRKQNHPAEAVR